MGCRVSTVDVTRLLHLASGYCPLRWAILVPHVHEGPATGNEKLERLVQSPVTEDIFGREHTYPGEASVGVRPTVETNAVGRHVAVLHHEHRHASHVPLQCAPGCHRCE